VWRPYVAGPDAAIVDRACAVVHGCLHRNSGGSSSYRNCPVADLIWDRGERCRRLVPLAGTPSGRPCSRNVERLRAHSNASPIAMRPHSACRSAFRPAGPLSQNVQPAIHIDARTLAKSSNFLTQPFLLRVSTIRSEAVRWMVAWDSQSGASAATLVAYGTVPTIVPETRQNSVSRANASQLVRSGK
jgi:hypothetical protein